MDANEGCCMGKLEVLFNSSNDDAVSIFVNLDDNFQDDDSNYLTGYNHSIVADVTLSLVTVGLLPFLQLMLWGNHLLYSLSST